MYEKGTFGVEDLSVPVVSVGNITVGGTGKTPVVADLISWSQLHQIPVGVISRGYKGSYRGVAQVSSVLEKDPIWGDEPTLLAQKFPEVPVYVCADRVLAGRTLLSHHQVKWIIADDAFQHRSLGRKMDLVVFDATMSTQDLLLLPKGRSRETLQALKRADFIILSKVNLCSSERFCFWMKTLSEWIDPRKIIEVRYELDVIKSVDKEKIFDHTQPIWLVSGIGNPQAFHSMMKNAGLQIAGHTIFPDHHIFREKNQKALQEIINLRKINQLVVTSKDLIKLSRFQLLNEWLFEAKLTLKWGNKRELLDQEILRLVS